MTLNATTTSILLNNLTIGNSYTARVVAFTRSGPGPYSVAVPLVVDPGFSTKVYANRTNTETWFFVFLSMMVIAVVSGISAAVYFKRKRNNEKSLGHFDVPVVSTDLSHLNMFGVVRSVNCGVSGGPGKDTLWIDGGWHGCEKDAAGNNPLNGKDGGSSVIDYAEVDSRSLSTFYNPTGPSKGPGGGGGQHSSSPVGNPTPYATTILLNTNECNNESSQTCGSRSSVENRTLSSNDSVKNSSQHSPIYTENDIEFIHDKGNYCKNNMMANQRPVGIHWSDFQPTVDGSSDKVHNKLLQSSRNPNKHCMLNNVQVAAELMMRRPHPNAMVDYQSRLPCNLKAEHRYHPPPDERPPPVPSSSRGDYNIGSSRSQSSGSSSSGHYCPRKSRHSCSQNSSRIPSESDFENASLLNSHNDRKALQQNHPLKQHRECVEPNSKDCSIQSSLPCLVNYNCKNANNNWKSHAYYEDEEEDDKGSCSNSSQGTCCSCSESSCLYAESRTQCHMPSHQI